jgi:hypothetical protein
MNDFRKRTVAETQRNPTTMPVTDVLGYAAAIAVLAAFCMSSIVPLRILAVLSNVLFVSYGLLANLYPVFLLHVILLPINLLKLAQAYLPLMQWRSRCKMGLSRRHHRDRVRELGLSG